MNLRNSKLDFIDYMFIQSLGALRRASFIIKRVKHRSIYAMFSFTGGILCQRKMKI